MNEIDDLVKEMEHEAIATRRMLSLVPDEKFQWKPHEKSMTLQQLARHLAEVTSWVSMTLTTSELDFANNIQRKEVTNSKEIIEYFDASLKESLTQLKKSKQENLWEQWTMRKGPQVLYSAKKKEVIRMAFNQTVHHRAQLGVYLRLLNIPLPGSYGPTADEKSFDSLR
ncbi:MAG TPA: DinB family protein [Flavitalea sp.]|nr:DinB family protein [Flavitalea sp.]